MNNDNRGFTVVELIVVIGIIAVLTAIAVPSFFTMTSRTAVKRTIRDVTVELKAARQLAISRNKQYMVVFTDSTTDTVSRQFRTNTSSAWVYDDSRAKRTFDSRVNLNSGSDTVTFNPNGSAETKTICIENVSDLSDKMKVDVYNITGRVEAGNGC